MQPGDAPHDRPAEAAAALARAQHAEEALAQARQMGFVQAGAEVSALLRTTIERMQPRNSTDLDSGLREAYRVATSQASGSRAGPSLS